jgi:uncharacterized membrane protein
MRTPEAILKTARSRAERTGGTMALPVRRLPLDAPWAWLSAGWQDMWRRPLLSLGYGVIFTLGAAVLAAALFNQDALALILPLAGGFLLIAPLAAAGLYDMSRRMERGEEVSAGETIMAGGQARGQLAFMGVVLLVIFMAWMDLAFLLFMLFWGSSPFPSLQEFVPTLLYTPHGLGLLLAGTAAGGILAALTFAISAVSVPLLMDRKIDTATAIATSMRAVYVNWQAMALWAALITGLMVLGFATLFAGLIFAFPLAGHATWHAYRGVVNADGAEE